MRWGGDQEGGGPYIFRRDDNPAQVTGFEIDLARLLAGRVGRPFEFVQCNWDSLLPSLRRGDIDLALNGCEYTPERAAQCSTSLPYYVYELGLCVGRNRREIASWGALELPPSPRKWRIGVLAASSADQYVTRRFAATCEILRYDGSTEALRLVETGQLDATVQDMLVLRYYLHRTRQFARLVVVDKPAAPGYYVLYGRTTDAVLLDRVNGALQKLFDSGELQLLYERYGIWNAAQQTLPAVWRSWYSQSQEPPRVGDVLTRELPLLARAAGVTLALAMWAMPLAILGGLGLALARLWGASSLGWPNVRRHWGGRCLGTACTAWVELIRGTPLAFQLFAVYFVLPEFQITISAFWSGVFALALNYSAYESEIFRLGLQAVPPGQMEAALALGMSPATAIRRIILPQAVRIVIPATANDFIALFKDTAVCSVIAVEELSKQYSMGAKSTGLFLEMAALASVLYLLMSYPLSRLAAWLERRLRSPQGPAFAAENSDLPKRRGLV